MTDSEFYSVLTGSGLPVAYLEFPEEACPDMPFITYQEINTDNFGADDKVYTKIRNYEVDLFTTKKDPDVEKKLEDALDAAGIFYNSQADPDEDERHYRLLYTMEV